MPANTAGMAPDRFLGAPIMKASVNDSCTGCGICTEICPEVFELNDQSVAVVKLDPVPAEHHDACREAAQSCPVEAITLIE